MTYNRTIKYYIISCQYQPIRGYITVIRVITVKCSNNNNNTGGTAERLDKISLSLSLLLPCKH